MLQRQLLTFAAAAARVRDAGIPITPRGVEGWCERHPGLKLRVAGRAVIPATAVDMVLAGTPLREVERRLKASDTAPPDRRGTGGRE